MPSQIDRRISFNGGEWSPFADCRLDTARYNVSCRTLLNMTPMTYGGAFSRAGLVYVSTQDNPSTPGYMVPFEFSAETRLMLVFTDGLIRPLTTGATPGIPQVVASSDSAPNWSGPLTPYRKGNFVTNGGTTYYCKQTHVSAASFATDAANWEATTDVKIPTPYTAEEAAILQFDQLNDLIFITHPDHPPHVLSRFADNRWTLDIHELEFPPVRDENITDITLTASGTENGTLTASEDLFQSGHTESRWVIKHRREEPFTELDVDSAPLAASDALMVLGSWSCSITAGEGTGAWDATAVVQRAETNPDPISGDWETIRTIVASREDRSSLITGTEIDPCWLRVKKISEAGSIPANGKWKLEAVDPNHYGIVKLGTYTNPTSITFTALFPLANTDPTTKWAEAAWSGLRGWPRAVCIADQSIWFGGIYDQPNWVWKSIINDFGNFRTGANDDLGIATYNSNQRSHVVQSLVSHGDMIVLTSGAEGPIEQLDSAKAIGPNNLKWGRFTQTGSTNIQAVAASDAVLFVSRNGRKVWELAFAFESNGYKSNDLTLLAEHITASRITRIALQKYPENVLWCVTEDGQLLGLLYERSQEVAGWFRYTTEGAFESVAVCPGEGESDEVWCTVRREINGETVRFIERFQPDRLRLLKDAEGEAMLENQRMICCADSAEIRTIEEPTTTLDGLERLEGATVCVLVDGAPIDNQTVTDGEITLGGMTAEHIVIVGLPFVPTLSPTYFETGDPGSVSKVAVKCISKVVVNLWRSMGCEVSTTGSSQWERIDFLHQGDVMDQALPLFTGIKETRVPSSSQQEATVIIRQTQPLPLNVQALHVFHELAGVS